MSVALRGNLEDFGIADVFQLIGQQRKTGVLEFSGEGGQVQLRFDRGAVVSAAPAKGRAEEALSEMLLRCGRLTRDQVDLLAPECDASAQTVPRLAVEKGWIEKAELEHIEDLLTRETFFEVLRWESGAFDFHAQAVDHSRRFESLLGAEQILMDGLRMVDEWQSFSEFVPSEDVVFQKLAGFEEYRRRTRLEASRLEGAERVYQLVDGRISVRRIIDISLLGTFDGVRLLADLRRCEVIEPLDSDAVARLRSVALPTSLDRNQAVAWVAGALPVLLLLGFLVTSLRPAPPPEPRPGFALPRAPIEDVRAAYRTQRVRHALGARRFAEGRWPADLAELRTSPLLGPETLAGGASRTYYYAEREGGALLLAPER